MNHRSENIWGSSEDEKIILRKSFESFGPSPRIALQCLLEKNLNSLNSDMESSIPHSLADVMSGLHNAIHSYDANSHPWCLICPDGIRFTRAGFVSLRVMRLIIEKQIDATAEFIHAIYSAVADIPAMGIMAGKIFEPVAHYMLWNGQNLAKGLDSKDEFQVKFTGADKKCLFVDEELQKLQAKTDGTWCSTYARPMDPNVSAAYSIGIIHNRLHLFQVTTDYQQTIDVQGLKRVCDVVPSGVRPTRERPLRFVWVVPADKSNVFTRRQYSEDTQEDSEKNRWDFSIQQYVVELTMNRNDFIRELFLSFVKVTLSRTYVGSKIHGKELVKAIKWE
jgi:hypothetical protein